MFRSRHLILLACTVSMTAACDSGKDDTGDINDGGASDGGSGDGGAAIDFAECIDNYCYLDQELIGNITLTSDKYWVLEGGVFVGGDNTDASTLTIEPGTTIYGDSTTNGFLVIRRGSKIQAVGTAAAPIVFTSAQAVGSRARADWGGLILNGNAPINNCYDGTEVPDCEAEGEGSTGMYGGNNPTDNSGTLKYVRVEFGGTEITTENEVNGIAFQGVGSGTTVDYVQVHYNKDDGVEFFGGTVEVSHLVITGAGDDAFDWTGGWSGGADHVVIEQAEDAGDRGLECDNLGDNNAAEPRANPTLSNFTVINKTADSIGMLLRAGTDVTAKDFAIVSAGKGCIDIDDAETWTRADAGNLAVTYTALGCATSYVEDDDGMSVEDWFTSQTGNFVDTDLGLQGWEPSGSSVLVGAGSGGGTIGAVEPGSDWTAGWTITDPS